MIEKCSRCGIGDATIRVRHGTSDSDINPLTTKKICEKCNSLAGTNTAGKRSADLAAKLIYGARATRHGDASKSFQAIGRIWGARLGIADIPAHIVCLMMQDLKTQRIISGSVHADHIVDNLGYGMLAADLYLGEETA